MIPTSILSLWVSLRLKRLSRMSSWTRCSQHTRPAHRTRTPTVTEKLPIFDSTTVRSQWETLQMQQLYPQRQTFPATPSAEPPHPPTQHPTYNHPIHTHSNSNNNTRASTLHRTAALSAREMQTASQLLLNKTQTQSSSAYKPRDRDPLPRMTMEEE